MDTKAFRILWILLAAVFVSVTCWSAITLTTKLVVFLETSGDSQKRIATAVEDASEKFGDAVTEIATLGVWADVFRGSEAAGELKKYTPDYIKERGKEKFEEWLVSVQTEPEKETGQ